MFIKSFTTCDLNTRMTSIRPFDQPISILALDPIPREQFVYNGWVIIIIFLIIDIVLCAWYAIRVYGKTYLRIDENPILSLTQSYIESE